MCDYQKARREGFGFLVLVCYFCSKKNNLRIMSMKKAPTRLLQVLASSDMTSSPAHIQSQVSQQDPGSLAPHQ